MGKRLINKMLWFNLFASALIESLQLSSN